MLVQKLEQYFGITEVFGCILIACFINLTLEAFIMKRIGTYQTGRASGL